MNTILSFSDILYWSLKVDLNIQPIATFKGNSNMNYLLSMFTPSIVFKNYLQSAEIYS